MEAVQASIDMRDVFDNGSERLPLIEMPIDRNWHYWFISYTIPAIKVGLWNNLKLLRELSLRKLLLEVLHRVAVECSIRVTQWISASWCSEHWHMMEWQCDSSILRTGIVHRTQNSPKLKISIRVVLIFEMFSAFRRWSLSWKQTCHDKKRKASRVYHKHDLWIPSGRLPTFTDRLQRSIRILKIRLGWEPKSDYHENSITQR